MPVTLQLTAVPHGDTAAWDMPLKADLIALKTAIEAAESALNTVVHLTGTETITGVKTFSNSPVVPTATTAEQAVNKGQMDTAISSSLGTQVASTADVTVGVAFVLRTTNPNAARPAIPSYGVGIWYLPGSVPPVNMADNDLWFGA